MAKKKVIMWKIMSCLVIIVILMSAVSVSVLASNSSDDVMDNVLDSLSEVDTHEDIVVSGVGDEINELAYDLNDINIRDNASNCSNETHLRKSFPEKYFAKRMHSYNDAFCRLHINQVQESDRLTQHNLFSFYKDSILENRHNEEIVKGTRIQKSNYTFSLHGNVNLLWSYVNNERNVEVHFDSIKDVNEDGFRDVVISDRDSANKTLLISGKDGSVIWSKSYPIEIEVDALGDDANGDGIEDIIINQEENGLIVELVSGRDGTEIWRKNVGVYDDAHAIYEDLDGDGIEDILLEYYEWYWEPNVHYEICALSAKEGSKLWSKTFGGEVLGYCYCFEDMNGDGIYDFTISAYNRSINICELFIIRGSDGSVEWHKSFIGDAVGWVHPRYDFDGDGLPDVDIEIRDPNNKTTNVLVLKGTDGSVIWGKSYNRRVWGFGLDDLNGDGTTDLCLELKDFTTRRVTEVQVLSGRDGSVIWSHEVDVSDVGSCDDLNKDGKSDILLVNSTKIAENKYLYEVIAISGADESEIWKSSFVHDIGIEIPEGASSWISAWADGTSDLNGDEIEDISLEVNGDYYYWDPNTSTDYGGSANKLVFINGKDGAELWNVKYTLDETIYSWYCPETWNDFNNDEINDVLLRTKKGVYLLTTSVQPIHTGYSGKILKHGTSGDTPPGDIIRGWMWVKNTGKYAKFKGVFEIKDSEENVYEDSNTEIINSGREHKFESGDGFGIRIPSDAKIGEYWYARFKIYVDVGCWEEVDSTSWEPFKIKSVEEPELQRDTPDEVVVRVSYGGEVDFIVKVYNADCVKWFIDNHYIDTTTDVSDYITGWKHIFYEDCTVTARAYKGEKSSDPINWKIEIATPPTAHYPQIKGYSPSDRSLELNPGDTTDFKVQVKDDDGDLDKVIWEVDGDEKRTDDVSGKHGESRFHYVAGEGDKEVKATVYDLQGNTDSITWGLEVKKNHPPELSDCYVTPTSGDTSTTFTYYVTYTDQDDDPPSFAYVNIDVSSMDHPMERIEPCSNYMLGCVYKYETTLPAGDHSYYFYFSDGADDVASDLYDGPMVTEEVNHAPTLSDGTVEPGSGDTSDDFTFSVTYKDEDGDLPDIAEMKLLIDGNSADQETYKMNTIESNPDYTREVEFICTTKLPPGKHRYYFHFRDINGYHNVYLPATRYAYDGPDVGAGGEVAKIELISYPKLPDGVNVGEEIEFKGKVIDKNGNTIPGIEVTIDDSILDDCFTATTNSNGIFTYSTAGVKEGAFVFRFSAGSVSREYITYVGEDPFLALQSLSIRNDGERTIQVTISPEDGDLTIEDWTKNIIVPPRTQIRLFATMNPRAIVEIKEGTCIDAIVFEGCKDLDGTIVYSAGAGDFASIKLYSTGEVCASGGVGLTSWLIAEEGAICISPQGRTSLHATHTKFRHYRKVVITLAERTETVDIIGTVRDKEGNGVGGADVQIFQKGYVETAVAKTTTYPDGTYHITVSMPFEEIDGELIPVDTANFIFRVTKGGYKKFEEEITLNKGEVREFNPELSFAGEGTGTIAGNVDFDLPYYYYEGAMTPPARPSILISTVGIVNPSWGGYFEAVVPAGKCVVTPVGYPDYARGVEVKEGKVTKVNFMIKYDMAPKYILERSIQEDTQRHTFSIPKVSEAHFSSYWEGSNLDIVLYTPEGSKIDYSEALYDRNVTFIDSITSEQFIIKNPQSGDWVMEVSPVEVPPSGENYSAVIYLSDEVPPSGDISISIAKDSQLRPTVAYNSANNEYLVTWYDYRRTGEEPDIYAQRVSGANNLLGSNFAIAISSGTDVKEVNPFVVYNPTANEYLVVWNEKYGYHNLYYIYAQRVSNTGSLLGSKITVSSGGVRVRKLHPTVAYSPANNEYLVVWYGQDVEGQPYRIYGQRLSSSGSVLGSNFAIGEDIGKDNYQYYPQVAYNSHSNDYLVVWEDMRNGGEKDIYAQRVSHSGSLLGSNFYTCNAANAQEAPSIAYNSDDNQYLVTWQDKRTGSNADIYAQRILGTGNLLDNEIAVHVGSGTSLNPSVTYNSRSNVYFVAWEENGDIFAQTISNGGALSGSSVVICDAANYQKEPSVAYNSANNPYFITWHDYRNGNYDIYAINKTSVNISVQVDPSPLINGVDSICALGVPGPLLALNIAPVPVVAGDDDTIPVPSVVVMASGLGNGRVVALGHEGFLTNEALELFDNKQFGNNAVDWLDKMGKRRILVATG